MKNQARGWSSEEEEKLRFLASQRKTSREIGEIIGRNRNQIIGFCYRNGIQLMGVPDYASRRGKNYRKKVAQESNKITKPQKPAKGWFKMPPWTQMPLFPEIEPQALPSAHKSLLNRNMTCECAYPIGEPKEQICCGLPIWKKSYCENHYRATHTEHHPMAINLWTG